MRLEMNSQEHGIARTRMKRSPFGCFSMYFYIYRIMMSLYNTCEQKHDHSGFTQIMPLNCNVIKLVNNMVIDSLFNTWPVHVFSILISAALVTWRWHSASIYNLPLNHTASSFATQKLIVNVTGTHSISISAYFFHALIPYM